MLAPEDVPANPERRLFLKGAVLLLISAGMGTLESCVAMQPSKEELAFYERLTSAPKGRRPITDFPDIVAGVGKDFPRILVDANQHKPPIGIDYEVNSSFPWTPIPAPARARVGDVGFHPQWGYYVTIGHGGREYHYTTHGHLQSLLLVKDDIVDRGTIIGFGGNTGSNARDERTGQYVFHDHIGATEPTFDPVGKPGNRVRVVNPHLYAENGRRLGTWNGNDLDSEYEREVGKAHQYSNYLINRLPAHVLGDISKQRLLGTKLGFMLGLLNKGILQQYIKDEPKHIEDNLKRFMKLRPIYTLFVNPQKVELYHIIIH